MGRGKKSKEDKDVKKKYMERAIELAKKGKGYTNPNPIVGAVIVKNNCIIGEGFHEKYGQLHAERNALASCKESPEGADMYVTLEPCCHYGKTPPCTDAIIENKIARVFVGSNDPNPLVHGEGFEHLRKAGIEVTTEVMKEECDELNRVFFHYIEKKKPYVTFKYAMTADGKIATATGKSKWITGEAARKYVHKLRHENAAIMVGIGTVLADDPLLNCRIEGGIDPVRIICDSNLRIPTDSQIVKTANEIRTIIVTCFGEKQRSEIEQEKEKKLTDLGCKIWKEPGIDGRVNLEILMDRLGEEKIDSVLLEGGSQLAYSVLKEGFVDKIMAFTAPKIFGGKEAKTPVSGKGVENPVEAIEMKIKKFELIGDDMLTEYEVKKCSRE